MQKHFQLYREIGNCIVDCPDFIRRKFPGQYYPAYPLFHCPADTLSIVKTHLCRGMYREIRDQSPGKPEQPKILYQYRISSQFREEEKILSGLFQFIFIEKRVHGNIDHHVTGMAEGNRLRKFFAIKITGIRTGTKCGSPEIYCVGSGVNCRLQCLHRPGRSEKFRYFSGNCYHNMIPYLVSFLI